MSSSPAASGHGILFHPSLLHSPGFTLLSAFVLINTVMFLALAILKMLPRVYVSDWFTSPNRRAETRGIYLEPATAVLTVPTAPADLAAPSADGARRVSRHGAAGGEPVRLPSLRRSRARHRHNRRRPG